MGPCCRCSWRGRSLDFFPSKLNRKLQHKLGLKFSSAAEKKVCGEGQEWEPRWLTLAVVHVRDDDCLSSDSPVGVYGASVIMRSHVQLLVTLWTVARQAPVSMGFPSKSIRVGCHFLLQEIFPTQGSNPRPLYLLHGRWILYQ